MRLILLILAWLITASSNGVAEIRSSVNMANLAKHKQTSLGLYLSPADAAAALKANPGILFLDVRDPIEVNFVGHPEPIDAIVPLKLTRLDFDKDKGAYKGVPNTDFVKNVDTLLARLARLARQGLAKSHPVFVICRSGSRSAEATNKLAEAGYTNVWNLVEGFEGDKDKSGVRAVNGWRNAGLPWTYKLTFDQAWVPSK